jgi:hypothetical protein
MIFIFLDFVTRTTTTTSTTTTKIKKKLILAPLFIEHV